MDGVWHRGPTRAAGQAFTRADRESKVLVRGVHRYAAPAAADVEQARARAQAELAADQLYFAAWASSRVTSGRANTPHEYVIEGPRMIA